MGGGGWVHIEFSVLLWSKALVLYLDQAEQYSVVSQARRLPKLHILTFKLFSGLVLPVQCVSDVVDNHFPQFGSLQTI